MKRAAIAAVVLACAGAGPREAPREEPLPVPFRIIAHRGASAYAPENTLAAVRRAWELGAVEVELDVQLSSDDALVLFHDSTLDEKTPLAGRVREHEAGSLIAADIGTWFDRTHPGAGERFAGTTLTTLSRVFEEFGDRFHYHLEIKAPEEEIPRRLLDEIRAHRLLDSVTITSFSKAQLERVRALDRNVRIGLLVSRVAELRRSTGSEWAAPLAVQRAEVDAAADAGFVQVAVRADELSPELVQHARARGLEIRAWKVRGPEDVERVLRAGANGMTVDWPDRLIERVGELARH